jgi:ferredoxin-NADP reductase
LRAGRCKIDSVALLTTPIARVVVETPRNRIVRVHCPSVFPSFQAGQYVSLGDHGQPVRKPYSIASSPAETARTGEFEFLIQVVDGEGPGPHLARLEAGRLVDVEGPAGTFVLPQGLRPMSAVLIGGGTGIAPLRAMLMQLLDDAPGARVAVLQSARTPEELCYSAELRLLAAEGRISLAETVTRDAPESWAGKRGRVDAHLEELVVGPDTWCFVCGPDSLVEGVPRLLAEMGVPASRVRTEHWADAVLAK